MGYICRFKQAAGDDRTTIKVKVIITCVGLNLAAFVFVFTLAVIRFFQTRWAYSNAATYTGIV